MKMLSTQVVEAQSEEKGTLFFLSGFPDRHNSFMDTLVPELKQEYRCIVACLPDMDQPKLSQYFGYSRSEIVALLDRTIKAHNPRSPLTLVLHDWGSIFGLDWYFKNKNQVSKLVCLDVLTSDALQTMRDNSVQSLFWFLLYQWWLTAAFLLGRILPLAGNFVMWALAALHFGPDLDPPPKRVLCPPTGPRWYMCYPYFRFWLDRVLGRPKMEPLKAIACPVFYAYGKRKRVLFHSIKQLEQLSSDPRHKIIAYDCGHWVQHAKTAELNTALKDFIPS